MPKKQQKPNKSVVRAIRFPKELWDKITESAESGHRPIAAEIVMHLENAMRN